jgi:Uma2 family endonuclease
VYGIGRPHQQPRNSEPQPTITVEEYLALEEAGHIKHEYVHGCVYAMAGGTLAHDIIANNVRVALHAHVGAAETAPKGCCPAPRLVRRGW